jgi:hypothetical protein
MKILKISMLVVLLLPTLILAQKKEKKADVPIAFDQARYVFVQAVDGEEFQAGVGTPDRLAIADVRDALQKWGRYTVTPDRDKADLIFVVHKGRAVDARTGAAISDDQDAMGVPAGAQAPTRQRPGGVSPNFGGETGGETGGQASTEDDLLKVCQLNANGKLGKPLWMRTFQGGLNSSRLILLVQLRDEVEKTYPRVQASPTSKP